MRVRKRLPFAMLHPEAVDVPAVHVPIGYGHGIASLRAYQGSDGTGRASSVSCSFVDRWPASCQADICWRTRPLVCVMPESVMSSRFVVRAAVMQVGPPTKSRSRRALVSNTHTVYMNVSTEWRTALATMQSTDLCGTLNLLDERRSVSCRTIVVAINMSFSRSKASP